MDAARDKTFLCDLGSSIALVNRDQAYLGRSLVVLKDHYEDIPAIPEDHFDPLQP